MMGQSQGNKFLMSNFKFIMLNIKDNRILEVD
jgi:hypothetical protein